MPIRRSTRVPFALRSRRQQKLAYRQVLNNIRSAAPILGGKFYCRHYMHGENGWIDAYFLGRHQPIFYNLYIQTTRYAYKEMVVDLAWQTSYEVAPVDATPSIFDTTVKDPATGQYVTPAREPLRYSELDGMTRLDWTLARLPDIANGLEVKVFENWTLHHDYHSGVGLSATVDAPFVTIEIVNAFIDRFLQSESAMVGTEPLSFRYDQIAHWGIEPNSIAQPWEWGLEPDEQGDSQGEVDPSNSIFPQMAYRQKNSPR